MCNRITMLNVENRCVQCRSSTISDNENKENKKIVNPVEDTSVENIESAVRSSGRQRSGEIMI